MLGNLSTRDIRRYLNAKVPVNCADTVKVSDAIKKLAAKVRDHAPKAKVSKSTRTLSLAEPNFSKMQSYCRAKGLPVSEVVDELIAAFLAEIAADDLDAAS